jgi:hypothetical protein
VAHEESHPLKVWIDPVAVQRSGAVINNRIGGGTTGAVGPCGIAGGAPGRPRRVRRGCAGDPRCRRVSPTGSGAGSSGGRSRRPGRRGRAGRQRPSLEGRRSCECDRVLGTTEARRSLLRSGAVNVRVVRTVARAPSDRALATKALRVGRGECEERIRVTAENDEGLGVGRVLGSDLERHSRPQAAGSARGQVP